MKLWEPPRVSAARLSALLALRCLINSVMDFDRCIVSLDLIRIFSRASSLVSTRPFCLKIFGNLVSRFLYFPTDLHLKNCRKGHSLRGRFEPNHSTNCCYWKEWLAFDHFLILSFLVHLQLLPALIPLSSDSFPGELDHRLHRLLQTVPRNSDGYRLIFVYFLLYHVRLRVPALQIAMQASQSSWTFSSHWCFLFLSARAEYFVPCLTEILL